jgi:hypothetical protein
MAWCLVRDPTCSSDPKNLLVENSTKSRSRICCTTGTTVVALPFLTICICAKDLEAFQESGERDTERDAVIGFFLVIVGVWSRGEFVAAENILVHHDMCLK